MLDFLVTSLNRNVLSLSLVLLVLTFNYIITVAFIITTAIRYCQHSYYY